MGARKTSASIAQEIFSEMTQRGYALPPQFALTPEEMPAFDAAFAMGVPWNTAMLLVAGRRMPARTLKAFKALADIEKQFGSFI